MGKISASVMCADLFNLEKELRELEDCKVDYLHLDVMDGSFVPNITLGLEVVREIKKRTDIPRDIHLLVNHPERYADRLDLDESDMVTFHFESAVGVFDTMNKVTNVAGCIEQIGQTGCKVGLVLNPETPVSVVEPFIDKIALVNIMMIHPGFAGLKMLDGMMDKIKQMRQFLDTHGGMNVEIEIDGNVSAERLPVMNANGGNIFVAGTSLLFRKDRTKEEAVELFRKCVGGEI